MGSYAIQSAFHGIRAARSPQREKAPEGAKSLRTSGDVPHESMPCASSAHFDEARGHWHRLPRTMCLFVQFGSPSSPRATWNGARLLG